MKSRPLPLIALFCAVLLGCGCAGDGAKDVLARIDEKETITLADFNRRISKLPQRYQDSINKNKKQFLDEVIVDVLLYKEAVRKKLDRDADVKEVIGEAKRKILIARLLQDEVEDKITITEEELADHYEVNKEKFETPKVLRASHILVKREDEARDVLVELSNGRNFEDLARARSADPTSKIGGDIGYFTSGQLVPEFEEACVDMKVGEISGIVETRFGYHIIKLTEREAPRFKELAEVREVIEQSLERLKKKMRFNKFVAELKEKSQITVNDELLKDISEEDKPED